MDYRKTVELKIPNEAGYEKIAMKLAASVAEGMGFAPERVEDLKTAVSEACLNAMQHGNQDDVTARLFVILTIEASSLAIDVKDEGRGGRPPETIESPDMEKKLAGLQKPRGLGLFVIQHLVDEAMFVAPDVGEGNQFRMVIRLEPHKEQSC
ncbi:MAG: ATP-binding protein [Chloroflexi bacterium]|nr:ATP-binding protein [Chloroflexota bacterium]